MLIDFFRERGWGREWNIHPVFAPTRDRTHNLHMCPDQELNLQPFVVQDDVPINWATRPGQALFIFAVCFIWKLQPSNLHFYYMDFANQWCKELGWHREKAFFKNKYFIYLLLERREGREKERERNINVWLPVMHPLLGESGPQPMHVPWLGIEPVTFWFAGPHSIHWSPPARVRKGFFFKYRPFLF